MSARHDTILDLAEERLGGHVRLAGVAVAEPPADEVDHLADGAVRHGVGQDESADGVDVSGEQARVGVDGSEKRVHGVDVLASPHVRRQLAQRHALLEHVALRSTDDNCNKPALTTVQNQFPVTRILMKIFKTRSSYIVTECQNYFGFYTIATLIGKVKAMFLHKLVNVQNELCELFSLVAQTEINIISYT